MMAWQMFKILIFTAILGFLVADETPERVFSPAANQLPNYAQNHPIPVVAKNGLGVQVPSMTASETVGPRGPITLKDTNLVEHLAHLNRERIPERVVHAKGFGARGMFQMTHDISQYTKACVFQPNTSTPILTRFSTTVFESGSPDTEHDTRGFAVKFYSSCGVYDWVGIHIPVFPIRDPALFPSIIHSRKRNPQTHLFDANSFWDFNGLRPETTFHTLQVFSFLGYPSSIRKVNGHAIHAFKFINAEGQAVFAKFHLKTLQGLDYVTPEELKYLKAENLDYFQQDLYDAIARGEFPRWELFIQVMTYERAATLPFNPFDPTKLWPETEFPLQPVGILTLNQNPSNFFSDVETAAFDPGNFIRGIDASPDKLLQGRIFSYSDAHRYRLGVNFAHLPVNRPLDFEQLFTYQRDGHCNLRNNDGTPNYFPNSYGGPQVLPDSHPHLDSASGTIQRNDTGDEDNFSQAREWWQNRTAEEKAFIVRTLAGALQGVDPPVVARVMRNMGEVDPELPQMIQFQTISEPYYKFGLY